MLSDRRPILLTNARIVDPSRDLDIDGDLLIADGVVRDARRGIGAAGVPEGTEIIDCRGRIAAPGLIDMRAFVGEPGAEYRETFASASQAAAAGGVTTIVSQPDTSPAIDEPAMVDFVLRRARDTAIVRVHPMAALTKGTRGAEMTEIGLLEGCRSRRVHRWSEERHQCPGDAPRPHLCPRFRRPHRASHRGPRPGRRRRDERGRVRGAARPRRRAQHRGDGDPGARHQARGAGAVALSRGLGHLRGFARGAAPRQGRRPAPSPPRLRSTISP